ncbi:MULTISPECIES: magnesium/cobalt transporter CorA [Alteromonadaceae]|uniref:magnesium/cobalt transporter CorA n=1 Tax=Alteromonadaceae TaxID=72275 RepID=UPI001C09C049|nr:MULTISPECIES: magnesium/cobalt transporter CorA [Aliiglaciecola]MBU2878258.1 magnesium/cobalt transporter CorA [Aliiglaciecola lipolytica]MDO6711831.1 magnesium/cobalt transporter CorA [Aliiglaciecola sp. 2_MG-2023]MDO6752995.1 magnesium/cobalt transporter CorA [Aliiglaciecola sp. 1_MG-2023]
MKLFRKQYGQPGAQPGLIDASVDGAVNITLFNYNEHQVVEQSGITVEQCMEYVNKDNITWVHVQGNPDKALLSHLATNFGIHELYIEDVANRAERPKIETHDGQIFSIFSLPVQSESNIYLQQVSLFLMKGTVVSFCSGQFNPFSGVKTRLNLASGKMRTHKADYLFYSLIDSVVDWCFPVLETYAQLIDSTEELLLKNHDKEILQKIHQLRRDVVLLRRQIWPQRELLNQLIRDDTQSLISAKTKVFLRDCYDHSISLLELIETYHEMTNGLMELYMSLVSLKLNEVMRVLTIIATLFIPPTFVVGIYGMNFNPSAGPLSMPELLSPYGYLVVWLIILSMVCGMLLFFKKRKWL